MALDPRPAPHPNGPAGRASTASARSKGDGSSADLSADPGAPWLASLDGARGALVAAGLTLGMAVVLAGSPLSVRSWLAPTGGGLVLCWLLAALGYGGALLWWLRRGAADELGSDRTRCAGLALSLALGCGVMMALDQCVGTLGGFSAGNAWTAWTLMGLGWGLLAVRAAARMRWSSDAVPAQSRGGLGMWLRPSALWLAAPAMAALVAAASVPPGYLWMTEFGGYDALSYHLLLPREWLEMGRIAPMPHNAYSGLPSWVESATLHLWAAWRWADVRELATAAQMLHALLAVAAATVIGSLARTVAEACGLSGRLAAGAAWCAALGVPWLVVTGSLAYNEMGALLGFAGALLAWHVAEREQWTVAHAGVAVGVALAAAIGSKLTSVGMAALPLAAWAMWWTHTSDTRAWRRLTGVAAVAAATAAVLLAPWMVRNWLATGNAFHPLLAGLLGDAWMTTEASARFDAGHSASGSLGSRAAMLWHRAFAYGLGGGASVAEPWQPQWSVMWWLAAGALAGLAWRGPRRVAAAAGVALAAQVVFWLLATHVQSRFLVPCIVPMSVVMGVAVARAWAMLAVGPSSARLGRLVLPALLLAWTPQCVWLLWGQANVPRAFDVARSAGYNGRYAGAGPDDVASELRDPNARMPMAWVVNRTLDPVRRVATLGEAAVFWCDTVPAYGTVWNGGPVEAALRKHGDRVEFAVRDLLDQGFSHVVVNGAMLDVWARAGWLDPAVTPERVRALLGKLAPVRPFSGMGEGTVYFIPGSLPGSATGPRP